jgi:hypothetical protein
MNYTPSPAHGATTSSQSGGGRVIDKIIQWNIGRTSLPHYSTTQGLSASRLCRRLASVNAKISDNHSPLLQVKTHVADTLELYTLRHVIDYSD